MFEVKNLTPDTVHLTLSQVLHNIIIPVDNVNLESEEIATEDAKVILSTQEEKLILDYYKIFVKELKCQPTNQEFSLTFVLQGAKMKNAKTGRSLAIHGISFYGYLAVLPGPRFHPFDELWLVMRNIFEGTSFTISRLGNIRKDK